MDIKLFQEKFVPAKIFFNNIATQCGVQENESLIYAESNHGIKKEQIIPFLYLHKNTIDSIEGGVKDPKLKIVSADLEIDDVLAIPQIALKIIVLKNYFVLYLESFDSPIGNGYNPINSDYNHLLTIQRTDIISFAKQKEAQFYGNKAKNSLKLAYNSRYGARGIIGRAIFMGITKLASKSEDDVELLKGTLYNLVYKSEGFNKNLIIAVDNDYDENFNSFLLLNWNQNIPEKKDDTKCFIATAVFGSYNHPIVYDLRLFRDNHLSKSIFGANFIKIYYSISPPIAKFINDSNLLKNVTLLFIIKPLHFIVKKMFK